MGSSFSNPGLRAGPFHGLPGLSDLVYPSMLRPCPWELFYRYGKCELEKKEHKMLALCLSPTVLALLLWASKFCIKVKEPNKSNPKVIFSTQMEDSGRITLIPICSLGSPHRLLSVMISETSGTFCKTHHQELLENDFSK